MEQVMTLAEIENRFAGEWILVGDPELDESNQVVRGKVLFHSRNRRDVTRKDREIGPKSAAYVFAGPNPEHVLVNL